MSMPNSFISETRASTLSEGRQKRARFRSLVSSFFRRGLVFPKVSLLYLQHHEKEEMCYAAFGPHGASRGEGAQEHHQDTLMFTKGSTDTFGAFLEEFTHGSWPLPDTGEMRSVSPFNNDEESKRVGVGHECPKSYSKHLDTATATSPTIATADASPSPPPATNGCCAITRGRPSASSTETCVESRLFVEKPETAADASGALGECSSSLITVHSSVRKITNATYLRRMHLSRDDATGLFPEFESTLNFLFMKSMSRREYSPPFKKGTCVYIHDVKGRRWPVVLECLRTAGQRHVRFNKGWAEMCIANRVSLGKCIRLARWEHGSSSSTPSVVVTLSIEK